MDKNIVALNIGISALLLVLLAMIASDVIAYRLSRVFPTSPGKEPPPVETARRDDLSSFSPILEKGLFGKATQGKLVPVAAPQGAAAATSPGDLVLLGTALGSFRETFALIQRQSTREEKVFRLGDRVFDMGTLMAVRKEGVEIRSNGSTVKLLTPTAVPGGSEAGEQGKTPGGLASQVAPGSYVVDQRALNAALDNIGQAMTDARLLPNAKDGKVEGFNLSEVKPAGIFGMVGLRNGDTLLRINEFNLDSPDKAMQSFVALKGQSRIKLDLIRDGRPVTLNYEIR